MEADGWLPLAAMLNELGVLEGRQLWTTLVWGAGEAFVALLLGGGAYDRLAG